MVVFPAVVVLAAFATFQSPTTMAAQTSGTPLLLATEPASASLAGQTQPGHEVVLRSRRARIAPAALALAPDPAGSATPARLTLNLFDDVLFEGIVERRAPTFSGGYALSGQIVEDPTGTVTLVVNGETVAGTVRTVFGTYRIRSAGKGVVSIEEVDESRSPFDCLVDIAGQAENRPAVDLRR